VSAIKRLKADMWASCWNFYLNCEDCFLRLAGERESLNGLSVKVVSIDQLECAAPVGL
jgi:hypothetical protein